MRLRNLYALNRAALGRYSLGGFRHLVAPPVAGHHAQDWSQSAAPHPARRRDCLPQVQPQLLYPKMLQKCPDARHAPGRTFFSPTERDILGRISLINQTYARLMRYNMM